MRPRRVAYVVNVFPKLSETFIAHELAELRRRAVEVRVLSLRRPAEALRHEMVASAGLDQLTTYETRAFAGVLQEFRPQLIHAHFATEPTAIARELSHQFAVPFTFTAHGYDIHRKAPPDFAERAAAARAVVTVSQANARHIAQTFGVPAERIRVIPCGVDTERFRPAVAHRKSTQRPLLVCVARHVRVKNLGLLLEACAALRARAVDFRCVMVGDGPCRQELEAMRESLGLEKVVEFVGVAEHGQVREWWQQASVAVLTSQNEGTPVCLMEAAACGVPAVATAVGGIPELVEDGVTGLLVPPGDAQALATALQRLLSDPTWTAQLGQAARRRAEERFSLARQVDCLLGLWAELLHD